MKGKGLPGGVTPDMAKQPCERSSSRSRANTAAGDGEKRTRNRNRIQSNDSRRAPPTQPARELCA
eukprot:9069893-Alexandrium_andersonii.AAC.1